MKTLMATLVGLVLLAAASTASAGYGYGYTYSSFGPPCGCGPVPVATYCGEPVVYGDPGYVFSAGPRYYPYRQPIVTSRVYYPYQPVRNVLRVLAP